MTDQNNDRRYVRTQKHLATALITLLETKNINQISVQELSDLADINRATFYLHYKTPYDLLIYLENNILDLIFTLYKNHNPMNNDDFLLSLYKCIAENREFLTILLNPNAGSSFWDRLSGQIKNQYNFLWTPHMKYLTQCELNYLGSFIIDGYISVMKLWLLNGMQETPDEMLSLSKRFQYNMLPKE
jgi:AcrR family transcriptional regulator